ncbi:hypothetical protein GR157_11660 [Burkholderia sp. 4701]|nr:hypothetical protein [Burkholderia sp. 4701]MXN82423.1 hypothetical protein [Burkholderia sp. 4812]
MEREIYTSDRNPGSADTSWLSKLGPGLITGAADDDPSGIATYSQAGAQFGFNLLWTVLLTYPLMVAIQLVSARIGRVSGHGLATNLRRHYPPSLLYGASSSCGSWPTRSGVGIIGTGMLALPVLAGSAAYSMAGTFGWKSSLALDAQLAKRIYGIIALATIVGLALDFTSLDPVKTLFWSAVINGVTSVPIMVLMMLMATNPNVVATFVAPLTLRILGWLSTGVMAAAVCAMFLFL